MLISCVSDTDHWLASVTFCTILQFMYVSVTSLCHIYLGLEKCSMFEGGWASKLTGGKETTFLWLILSMKKLLSVCGYCLMFLVWLFLNVRGAMYK